MSSIQVAATEGSTIHPVFHVSLLKKKVGNNAVVSSSLPKVDEFKRVEVNPVAILDRKIMKKGNRVVVMRLIQWSKLFKENATQED